MLHLSQDSVSTSSARGHTSDGFTGQTKDFKMGVCCVYVFHAVVRISAETGQSGVKIMCLCVLRLCELHLAS